MTLKRSTMPPRKAPIRTSRPTGILAQASHQKIAKMRVRKCAVKTCRKPFEPRSAWAKACSPECAAIVAKVAREADERKVGKAKRESLKSRADWERETQTAVNAYVRLVRDAHLTCISCGRWHDGQWHAGHYLSRGARPGLRFVEANIAKQCMPCNVHLSGNQVNFRIGLVARIGLEAVEALESDDAPRKHSIEELKALKAHYKAKLKELGK